MYQDSRKQSERNLPDLGSFRHAFMSVKQLAIKERFSSIYGLFLFLYNSYVMKSVRKNVRKH